MKLQYKKITKDDLVTLSKNSDYKALEELIKRVQKDVYSCFSYLCNTQDRVPDLTQEALLKMSKSIKSLKDPKMFKFWLNRIVMNLFYDDVRKYSKAIESISIDDNIARSIPDNKEKPNDKVISSETENTIKMKIKNLPDNYRTAIVLREFQGLTYEEIAKITSSNIGTVKSRIARAREKLQKELTQQIQEE